VDVQKWTEQALQEALQQDLRQPLPDQNE